jgi:hypothetical protein
MVNVLESTSGEDIMYGYGQLRHRVPYTMFFFGFGLCEYHNQTGSTLHSLAGGAKEVARFKRRL